MKFLSTKEFFYKLNTIGFILLLLPVLAFIFLFFRSNLTDPIITDNDQADWLAIGSAIILIIVLTIVNSRKNGKIGALKNLIELSRKMDGYGEIFLTRMAVYAGCCLLMVVGFFLTESNYFSALFSLIIVINLLQWPLRQSFCRLLGLNKNETDMILTGSDVVETKKKRT